MSHFLRRRGIPFSIAVAAAIFFAASARAQEKQNSEWVEEPAAKSLNLNGESGRSYIDPSSVHRGDDGLVYFTESMDVMRAQDVGRVGIMKDAYDCNRDIKYMCVGAGDWRNDPKSTVDAAKDPARAVYRKFLCGDVESSGPSEVTSKDKIP